jgi:phosphodiesterase/alkaline phosphatase D-like protein
MERKKFIERFQQFARERSVRVSFLGGDVHCCGAGKLYSKDMKEKEEGDPYFMVQIISSAIVNVPPPQALLTILNQNGYITFNGNTEERMYNLFKRSPNGNTVSFNN